MLRGRESLIRFVGKRRRFLPNRHSLLSSPIQVSLGLSKINIVSPEETPLDQHLDCNRETVSETNCATPVWVACPVCGNRVRGEDHMINSHLDTCLGRGTKRKMSQRTLLQLNFCTESKVKDHFHGSDSEENDSAGRDQSKSFICDSVHKKYGFSAAEEFDKVDSKPLPESEYLSCGNELTENSVKNDKINRGVDLPTLLMEKEEVEHEIVEPMIVESTDVMSGTVLKTFIVGRKFSDIEEISSEASIGFLRDPNNVKDSNAIKVLCADSEGKVLGFLPRELALHLSPLIDMYGFIIKGCITSVPKSSRHAVPIEITLKKMSALGEKAYDDLQAKSLWEKAFYAAETSKTHLLGFANYQQNFSLLIQEVLRSYSHLFSINEKIFLENFSTLSDDSQRLFIRLYTRKGPWFRMSNISYPEILDCCEAVKRLDATGYIRSVGCASDVQDDELKDIINVLSVSELREITYILKKKHKVASKKQDLVTWLLSTYKDGLCPLLLNLVLEKTGTCIQISSTAESLVWRNERLFFLNGEQDLSAFLLVDMGIVKYPTYSCKISNQIFASRSDFLAYEEAIEVAQIMDQSLDESNADLVLRCIEISDSRISDSSPKVNYSSTSEPLVKLFSCFSASWVYSKVVLLGVSFLERERKYVDAVNLLRRLLTNFTFDRRRGYWTLRLSIDLEHMGFINESLSVAENGLLDPCVRAGSRTALQRRVVRLAKPPRRWKTPSFSDIVKRKITEVHVQGRPLNCITGEKSRFYGEDGELCEVEQVALQFYAGEGGGWHGVHTESGIWLTIFGLLMWDIIFSDVPDVFRTKFQTAPLDLEMDCFYEVRKKNIEPLLSEIYDGMGEEILISSYESHFGTSCWGVNWDRHSLSELRAAVTCIGGPCLASICRQLAQDYRSWSSGMPDLLLWRFLGDYRGEAKLVEVKGPRDKLSEQQRAWLLFLMDCGFNTEVCKVSPAQKAT